VVLGLVIPFALGGWSGLLWGGLVRMFFVHHVTWSVNSVCHTFGRREFATTDRSRNQWTIGLLGMGEGWHNNHHAYQSSVRQGFKWWEIDPTYYLLRALSWIGFVWDLKTPPEPVLRNEQRLGAKVVNRAAEELAARFNSERIAAAITSALHTPELSALQETLLRAQHRTGEMLKTLHVPHIPSREEFLREAKAMFARTRSLDEIVDRAYELLIASVGARLTSPVRN
jgi:stearoyl-CoA desaturase (delta-9 desaturase)